MQGLELTMNKLANSKGLGVISRMASGILPNFWAVQNKIRAGFTIIDEYFKKQRNSTKEALDAMEALVQVGEMAAAMKPFDAIFNTLPTDKKELENLFGTLKDNMEGISAIELSLFGDRNTNENPYNIAELTEILEMARDLVLPQKTEIDRRVDEATRQIVRKRKLKDKLEGMGIKEGTFRARLVEKQLKFFDFFTKIRKGFKGFIESGLTFFKTAMKWFMIVTLTLFAIVTAFRLLRDPLTEAFAVIKEEITWILGGIFNTIIDLVDSFSLLIEGFAEGNFLMVLEGLLLIVVNTFKLVGQVIGGIIFASFITVVSVLGEILESLLEGGEKSIKTLSGILMTIGLIMGALTYLGIAIFSLPITLGFIIGGFLLSLIPSFVKKFSTGGIVNSNMQLVGERGAELVSLPRGSRVHSNADSKRMLSSSGGNTINVHVNGRVGASDAEIRDIANKVAKEINLRMSRTGSGVNNF